MILIRLIDILVIVAIVGLLLLVLHESKQR